GTICNALLETLRDPGAWKLRIYQWALPPKSLCRPSGTKTQLLKWSSNRYMEVCMRKHLLLALFIGLIAALPICAGRTSGAADISGTWKLSVDLEDGSHGDPTFVFKQEDGKLTGTYDGPLGQYKVTGSVEGAKAVFGFDFTIDGEASKASYTGNIESSTKMTGTVEFKNRPPGKVTATNKT